MELKEGDWVKNDYGKCGIIMMVRYSEKYNRYLYDIKFNNTGEFLNHSWQNHELTKLDKFETLRMRIRDNV